MPFPFRNKTLQFEALRALGYSNNGGADPNEVIELCGRIREGNLNDWFVEWRAAGLRSFSHGEESEKLKDLVSSSQAFLRASNYLRTAEFFRRDQPAEDKEALEVFDQSREAFYRAMSVSPQYKFHRVEVPFEKGNNLPAYLIVPAESQRPRSTVVVNGGFDGTKEEAYLAFGAAALARGYNFFCFDGPGQGETIRHRRLPFRPDWYVVVTAVTDFLTSRKEVDNDRLVLIGWSMGGWLAAQAATREHRYAALILNDGVFDFSSPWRKQTPWFIWTLLKWNYTGLISSLISLSAAADIGSQWAFRNALWTFNVPDGAAILSIITQYTLTRDSAQQIKTPMLILDPESDHMLKGQPEELINHLGSHQRFDHVVLETRWGAGEHSQMGAMAEQDRVMYNWLATILSFP